MTHPSKRQERAREWISATDELRSLTDPVPTDRPFFQRVRERLTARRSEVRVRELRRGLHSTRLSMEHLSVGADPHEWGVLSGGALENRRAGNGSFLLEDTLKQLTWPDEATTETANEAHGIIAALPGVRADAELGHKSGVAAIETRLLSLTESPDLEHKLRRQLLEHLPARLRPIPKTLHSLERGQPPVTLFLSLKGPDVPYYYAKTPRIELVDIVISRELRGKGLGTAALTELCMYADLHSLPIEGMLEPGPGEPDETVSAVSRWYARMGFIQGEREPHQWRRGGTIYRAPCPSKHGGSGQL